MRSQSKIYDRMALDLPINAVVSRGVVDDPLEPGAKVMVLRSTRTDPFAAMFARGHIDEVQFASGRVFQRHRERSEVGSIHAIDPTREAVDGGRFKEPDVTAQSAALAALKRVDDALQPFDASLIHDVLTRNMSIRDICVMRSVTSSVQRGFLLIRFRGALDVLAVQFGLATRA